MNHRNVYINCLLLMILTLATFFRVYDLNAHDFWYDEFLTLTNFNKSWESPFYQTFIFYWIKWVPVTEFSLRIPSAAMNVMTVFLIYLFGKKLFSASIGLLSASLLALSPYHIWAAQEARNHSFACFFSLLASYFFIPILHKPKNIQWFIFIVYSILAISANYFFSLILLTQAGFLFIKQKRIHPDIVILFIALFLTFAPHFETFSQKLFLAKNTFSWIPHPTILSIGTTLRTFLIGYTQDHFHLSSLIILAITFRSFYLLKKSEYKTHFILCLSLFLCPLFIIFFFSTMIFPLYTSRFFLSFTPFFYVFLAIGILSFPKKLKFICMLLFALILIIGARAYYNNWIFGNPSDAIVVKKPVKPYIHFIQNQLKKDDLLTFTHPVVLKPFQWYNKNSSVYFLYDPDLISFINPENPINQPYKKIKTLPFKRLWVISADWAREGNLDENSNNIKKDFDNELELIFSKNIDGIWIYQYQYPNKNE